MAQRDLALKAYRPSLAQQSFQALWKQCAAKLTTALTNFAIEDLST